MRLIINLCLLKINNRLRVWISKVNIFALYNPWARLILLPLHFGMYFFKILNRRSILSLRCFRSFFLFIQNLLRIIFISVFIKLLLWLIFWVQAHKLLIYSFFFTLRSAFSTIKIVWLFWAQIFIVLLLFQLNC